MSEYLNSAIINRENQPRDPASSLLSQNLTICLPEENPISFEIINNWTINHTFLNPITKSTYFYTRLIEAYLLAERLLMPEVCNAMLAELYAKAPSGLVYCHGFIYTHTTPRSPLRRMLIDLLVNDSRLSGIFDLGPEYGVYSKFFFLPLPPNPFFPISWLSITSQGPTNNSTFQTPRMLISD